MGFDKTSQFYVLKYNTRLPILINQNCRMSNGKRGFVYLRKAGTPRDLNLHKTHHHICFSSRRQLGLWRHQQMSHRSHSSNQYLNPLDLRRITQKSIHYNYLLNARRCPFLLFTNKDFNSDSFRFCPIPIIT